MPAQYDIWAAVRRGLIMGSGVGIIWAAVLFMAVYVGNCQ